MTDGELARYIAETAGQILVTLQKSGLFEGKALGKAGKGMTLVRTTTLSIN